MKLTMNIKPTKKEAYTKQGAKPRIRGVFGSKYCSYGSNIMEDDKYVYVYNLEKHRKKSERYGANNNKLKKARIVSKKWVCYYYQIPIELLKIMNVRVVQGNRTFKLENIK